MSTIQRLWVYVGDWMVALETTSVLCLCHGKGTCSSLCYIKTVPCVTHTLSCSGILVGGALLMYIHLRAVEWVCLPRCMPLRAVKWVCLPRCTPLRAVKWVCLPWCMPLRTVKWVCLPRCTPLRTVKWVCLPRCTPLRTVKWVCLPRCRPLRTVKWVCLPRCTPLRTVKWVCLPQYMPQWSGCSHLYTHAGTSTIYSDHALSMLCHPLPYVCVCVCVLYCDHSLSPCTHYSVCSLHLVSAWCVVAVYETLLWVCVCEVWGWVGVRRCGGGLV